VEIPIVKEIVTVSEMARSVGLSRARFYQLVREGVFPEPSRKAETGRPFFNRQQQEECLLVRKTNRGANGRAILFYGRRVERMAAASPKRGVVTTRKRATTTRKVPPTRHDPRIEELRHGLEQLGLGEIAETRIRSALAEAYPDGHGGVETAELLMTVFRKLRCQNSQDSLAG